MSIGWDSLPLLPLRCVLEHLSTEDALAAMTVCRHWRTTILLYEGHKDTLKLNGKQPEKCMFLTRLFRKHAKKLHIYLNCTEEELEKLMTYVLPQYFDSVKLREILFIGPSYLQQNQNVPVVKLKRIITESLVFKHLHNIQKLALIGCEMDTAKNESDRYTHKHVEYYSRPLSFNSVSSRADAVLSSCNTNMMLFSTLQHIMVDYEQISTEALQTLSHLTMFSHLTMNICNKRRLILTPIDWHLLQTCYPNGLDVSLNIIGLPYRKFNDIMESVLVEGLALTSIKVLFCKTLYTPLITHVVALHKATLRELVWSDGPYESPDPYHRLIQPVRQPEYDTCNVNPFILLCWQCTQLRRLVIHGYWVWQYDILGFVRLRKTLERLEISSIYNKRAKFSGYPTTDKIMRVLAGDSPRSCDHDFIQQVNEFTEFHWRPVPWNKLHPALRARASAEQRADYVLYEAHMASSINSEQGRQRIQGLRQQ